jgi:membrane associated rhomboid family serine protease
MTGAPEIALRVARERGRVDEWALVLVAEGLSAAVEPSAAGFELRVPADQADRASAALAAFDRENPPRARGPDLPRAPLPEAALLVPAALVLFFGLTGPRSLGAEWFARGSADAERILAGELWRTVTALTLHADLGHVAANALVGALLLAGVCRTLGSGLGLALVLLSGAAGNLANAVLRGSDHVLVGASTAVFGALGILAACAVVRRRAAAARGRAALVPLAAGLALLGFLGTGERADLWAHGLGFVAGAALGAAAGRRLTAPPPPIVQWGVGLAALGALVGCWACALR